jgi:hypothetical protein
MHTTDISTGFFDEKKKMLKDCNPARRRMRVEKSVFLLEAEIWTARIATVHGAQAVMLYQVSMRALEALPLAQ